VLEELQRWQGGGWVTRSATSYEYSTRCQLDKMTAGAGSATESVTEYDYDCDGNLERVWDANHPSAGQTTPASTEYAYDELDRLVALTQPWGGAGGGDVVTTYGYDVQDHLTEVIDGEGNVTGYVYSDRDLMTRETSEVSGITEYVYNEHGELTSQTDARGITMERTVDELEARLFHDGVESEHYADLALAAAEARWLVDQSSESAGLHALTLALKPTHCNAATSSTVLPRPSSEVSRRASFRDQAVDHGPPSAASRRASVSRPSKSSSSGSPSSGAAANDRTTGSAERLRASRTRLAVGRSCSGSASTNL
jgi:YD repeat-containing protein